MEIELPSDYLLKDDIGHKNNDTFNDTLDENISLPMQNIPEFDYITDHTVPIGWSYKGVGGSLRIRSPEGSDFRSRRQALEAMIVSGRHSFEEINTMKYFLQFEGWQESDKIPFGWRLKIHQSPKSRNILLMEQGGKKFCSVSEAVKFVYKYQKYYKEGDAEMLVNNFLNNNTITKSGLNSRKSHDVKDIRSRILQNNFSIRERSRKYKIEGWKTDETIYPDHWKNKER